MRYSVSMSGYASTVVYVEADGPDEAREKAEQEVYVSLCHQCAGHADIGDEWEPTAVLDEDNETVWEKSYLT